MDFRCEPAQFKLHWVSDILVRSYYQPKVTNKRIIDGTFYPCPPKACATKYLISTVRGRPNQMLQIIGSPHRCGATRPPRCPNLDLRRPCRLFVCVLMPLVRQPVSQSLIVSVASSSRFVTRRHQDCDIGISPSPACGFLSHLYYIQAVHPQYPHLII